MAGFSGALKALSAGLLLVLGFYIQFHFLASYPQPMLFGDPGAYYRVGVILRDAIGELREGTPVEEVLESTRPYVYLVGVASVYGGLEALRGKIRRTFLGAEPDAAARLNQIEWLRPIPFFRLAFAIINSLGMLGCFLLGRELSRGFGGGLLALGAASVYPSFALQTGRIFPEPVFGLFFVGSAFCYVRALRRESVGWMLTAGLLLSIGFFLRPQLMNFFPFLFGAAFALSIPFWLRSRQRRLALTLGLSVLPAIGLWSVTLRMAGGDFSELEKFGFYTFPQQQKYPYGFWVFMDSDGWSGPYQLREDPFYLALAEQAEEDRSLLRSPLHQYAFAARYVARRWRESSLLVLDNVFRLYDRPANNFQWDYPFSTRHQSAYQKAIVVLAVVGITAFALESPALAGLGFVPLTLAAIFGLSTPQPRYGQPAAFILIAVAAAFVARVAGERAAFRAGGARGWTLFRRLAAPGLALLLVGRLLSMPFPEAARGARGAATLALLGLPFVLAWIGFGRRRGGSLALFAAWVVLALIVSAHLFRDRRWHEVEIALGGDVAAVEQEILLSSESLWKLRAGTQAFVVLDVHAPAGTLAPSSLVVNDKAFFGNQIFPAMPYMGESTVVGGRNPRRYRQWWAFPLGDDLLPLSAPATLRIRFTTGGEEPIFLYGDRFSQQERVYEGPSFGNWPYVSGPKMEYDGDYRLPVVVPLASAGTRSFLIDSNGRRERFPGALRVRVVTLTSNVAQYEWESGVAPAEAAAALGFFAYSHGSGEADLRVDQKFAVRFPLGAKEAFDRSRPPYRLCFRPERQGDEPAYGGYILEVPPMLGSRPLVLTVEMMSGMSLAPMFFSVDGERKSSDLEALARKCALASRVVLVNGLSRVVNASQNAYPTDTGRWSTKDVF
jgi:hypothetical protein